MSTSDAERLAAGLDEDEQRANAAASVAGPAWRYGHIWPDGEAATVAVLGVTGAALADTLGAHDEEVAPFVAHNDPKRVLADIEAKRRILALYEAQPGWYLPEGVSEGRDPDERERDEAVREALGEVVSILAGVYAGMREPGA